MKAAAGILILPLLAMSFAPLTHAQSGVSRRELLVATLAPEKTVSVVDIREVTIPANQKTGLHLHPIPVVGVIYEGEIFFQVEGEPAQHLKAGDAFFEPANRRIAHFDNEGATPARFAAFYLRDKDNQEIIRMLKD